jgi:hypothetical protein
MLLVTYAKFHRSPRLQPLVNELAFSWDDRIVHDLNN